MEKSLLQKIKNDCNGEFRENELMAKHTSWFIGGPADLFVYPENMEDVFKLIQICKENGIPKYVIGYGSNLLINDSRLKGIVMNFKKTFNRISIKNNFMTVGSGVGLTEVIRKSHEHNLSGIEYMCGIPGTIGGSIINNAGVHNEEIGACVNGVTFIDENGDVQTYSRGELSFTYRSSNLKGRGAIICDTTLELVHSRSDKAKTELKRRIRERNASQPVNQKTAGSVFKNPPGYSAGSLIEEHGCKGWSEGDAKVSERHANFIINTNKAKASDVLRLIERIRETIYKESNIELELEVEFIN